MHHDSIITGLNYAPIWNFQNSFEYTYEVQKQTIRICLLHAYSDIIFKIICFAHIVRDHSFSAYVKFPKKSTFFIP